MGQFKKSLGINVSDLTMARIPTDLFKLLPEEILLMTQGSWGNQTSDEIDNQLAQQRQVD